MIGQGRFTSVTNCTNYDECIQLVQHARYAGLGMPVTPEFEAGAHVVQGYERGIVYALAEDRSQTGHMLW